MDAKKDKIRSFSLNKYLFNEDATKKLSPKSPKKDENGDIKFEGFDFNLVDRNQQMYRVY